MDEEEEELYPQHKKDLEKVLADKAKEVATGWEPHIRIAVESLQSYSVLFGVLYRFLESHPTVEIDVCESVLNGGWEALEQDRVDLLVGSPGPVPAQKGYRAVPLARADMVLVIASQHPLAAFASNPETLETTLLKLRRVILHDTSLTGITRSAGLVSDRKQCYVQNIDHKVEAIKAGIGIGHLPRHRIQHLLDSGKLIQLKSSKDRALENFLSWKLTNKGKGLHLLTEQLLAAFE